MTQINSITPVAMASGRASPVLFVFIALFCATIECKVFTRCQLTRELLKNKFPRTFMSNWVCLIEKESDRNTSALVVKTARKKYHGLFHLGSEWCKEGRKGGKCDIPCEALLDDDIKNDGVCALKVFELEGFKYWSKWESRCKGSQNLPDVERCPDWQNPPSRSSVSPGRDKRNIMRSLRKLRSRRFVLGISTRHGAVLGGTKE